MIATTSARVDREDTQAKKSSCDMFFSSVPKSEPRQICLALEAFPFARLNYLHCITLHSRRTNTPGFHLVDELYYCLVSCLLPQAIAPLWVSCVIRNKILCFIFLLSTPLLFSACGTLFPHPRAWRKIAESLTILPQWLKLTQTHSVSFASFTCSYSYS